MKKFLGFIVVLSLLSLPVMAQVASLPQPVSLYVEIELGATITPDITALSWIGMEQPVTGEAWVAPDNPVINWELTWRDVVANTRTLFCELTAPIDGGTAGVLDPEIFFRQTWTSPMADLNVGVITGPPGDGTPQIVTTLAIGKASTTATLEVEFLNQLTISPGAFAGEFTYTLIVNM